MDPQEKTFFKGLDSPSTDGKTLSFQVPGINSTGTFRLCTITGANTHQQMIMPVAKRGAQDDCIRFTVTG